MINNRLVNISVIMFGVLTLVFVLFPSLDVAVSNVFYSPEFGFQYKKQPVIQFFFIVVPILTGLFVAIFFTYLLNIIFQYKSVKSIISSWAFFLLITAAIGPGIAVNSTLKENFGHAWENSGIRWRRHFLGHSYL